MSYVPEKKMISNVSSATSVIIPASNCLLGIVVQNTSANAITGGLKIGTTAGGVDVVTSFAVSANSLGMIDSTLILKKVFSKTVDTTLYIDAVTLWNSGILNFTFLMREF